MASITFYRGDSYPLTVTITDTGTRLPIDITAATITLTVDAARNPSDETTKKFSLAGILDDDPTTGVVTFTPTTTNNDISPGTYYYDIQMTQGTTVRTLEKDEYIITQDLNKN